MGLPPAITANLNAIKAGKAAPYIVNKPFFDSSVNLGGTGATLGLIIAIWLVGRKNKQYSIDNIYYSQRACNRDNLNKIKSLHGCCQSFI